MLRREQRCGMSNVSEGTIFQREHTIAGEETNCKEAHMRPTNGALHGENISIG